MKIIDLLNKIAKGEEVPQKIMFRGDIFEYRINTKCYERFNSDLSEFIILDNEDLNTNVEILETTLNTKDMNITSFEIKDNQILGTWKNGSPYHYTLSAPQKVLAEKMLEIIEVINGKDK